MKKIITLSIVCLASGQLFAQTSAAKAQPTATKTKAQIETQRQSQVNGMSLQQAAAAQMTPPVPAIDLAPVAPVVAAQKTTPVAAAKSNVKPEAKPLQDASQVQSVKSSQDAKPAAESIAPVAPKKED